MKSYTGKELLRLLRKHGWHVTRIEGSHHILTHTQRDEILSVPVHGNKTLRIGTAAAILKNAHIPEE